MMEMEGHRRGICEVQRGRKRREDGGAGEGIPDTPQGPGGRWGGRGAMVRGRLGVSHVGEGMQCPGGGRVAGEGALCGRRRGGILASIDLRTEKYFKQTVATRRNPIFATSKKKKKKKNELNNK